MLHFYLKYHITKPLLKCQLRPLLKTHDGKLLLDILLNEIDDNDKIKLYQEFNI